MNFLNYNKKKYIINNKFNNNASLSESFEGFPLERLQYCDVKKKH